MTGREVRKRLGLAWACLRGTYRPPDWFSVEHETADGTVLNMAAASPESMYCHAKLQACRCFMQTLAGNDGSLWRVRLWWHD